MAKIDTLVVEFLANNTQFNKGIEQVQTKLGALQKVIQGVSIAAAAMFVRSHVSKYVEQATAVGQLSKSIGENAEEIQTWGEAVQRTNGSAEAFQGTVKSLSDSLNLIPIEGNSPLIGYLTRLNINFRNVDGSIKKPLQLLKELAQRFEGMSNAQSMSIGKKLGLDEGTVRLLQQGTRGVSQLLDKSKALGVYTQKEIETANKLKGSFKDFSQTFNIFGLRVVSFFIPIIDKLTKGLTSLVTWINKNERAIKAFFLAALIPSLLKAIPIVLSFGAALWASLLPITAIIAALALLGLAFEDAFAYLEGGESITGKIAQWFSDAGFAIEEYIKKILDFFIDIGFGFEDFIQGIIDAVVGSIKDAFGWMTDLLSSAKDFFKGAFKGEGKINIKAIPDSIPNAALSSADITNIRNQSINIGTIEVKANQIDSSNMVSTPLNSVMENDWVNQADGALNG